MTADAREAEIRRPDNYYVRRDAHWLVATMRLVDDKELWYIAGSGNLYQTGELKEIGPRIPTPDELARLRVAPDALQRLLTACLDAQANGVPLPEAVDEATLAAESSRAAPDASDLERIQALDEKLERYRYDHALDRRYAVIRDALAEVRRATTVERYQPLYDAALKWEEIHAYEPPPESPPPQGWVKAKLEHRHAADDALRAAVRALAPTAKEPAP